MIRALLYLQVVSTWNQLVARLRRLKKPKYLAGFLVGGLYFFFYFVRPVFFARPPSPGRPTAVWPALTGHFELIAAVVLAVVVLGAWIFPQTRAALSFSEAEAAFLFPAPVRRRTLIHFKLLRSQASILFSTMIMALVSTRFSRGSIDHGAPYAFVGWWLILSTMNLHFIGASFARSRLLDRGIGHWTRRWMILGALALAGLAAAWWLRSHLPPAPKLSGTGADLKAVLGQLRDFLHTQPLAALLSPFRWMVRPGLAASFGEFLRTIGPALLILVGHYLWVIGSAVAFEEASLDQARRRAEKLATLRREPGRLTPERATRAPFTLRPRGPAAVAFLWKNLIYAGSLFTPRMWLLLTFSLGIPAVVIGLNARRGEFFDVIPLLLVMALVWSVLLGPQLLRHDLRQDLRSAELLKLYPLPGWKIILGELLAPAAILTAIQWTLLGLLTILFTGIPGGSPVELSTRLSMATGAALVCPALNLISLLVPNAALLLFPAWLQTGPGGPQGIEATGQRLIFLLGQLIVFSLALLPGAAAALGAYLLATLALPSAAAVPVAGAAAACLLLAEAGLGMAGLGKLFERLDVAAELRA